MLEITLENREMIRIQAEDLDFEIDADGDLRVKVCGDYVAYYPAGQWRHFVNMQSEDTRTEGEGHTTITINRKPDEDEEE